MRIIFSLLDCGLANNGGSQTIIRMAEELKSIGNDVIIATNVNNFTWFKVSEGLIKRYSNVDEVPECDAIIATACSTVNSVLKYNKLPISKKFYWIRGYEIWAMSKENLAKGYTSGLNLLVNSEWQKEFLYNEFGVSSRIQYSGVPIYEIKQYVRRKKKEGEFTIGALYNPKPFKRFSDVWNICSEIYKKDFIKEFMFFGDSSFNFDINKEDNLPIIYFRRPNMKRKIRMMNECDIWLSTSVNEGLHIPPLEAGLTGCLLVARNFRSSGVSDYAINEITAKTYLSNEEAVEKICEYHDEIKNNRFHVHNFNLDYLIKNKIGSVRENAIKFEKILRK